MSVSTMVSKSIVIPLMLLSRSCKTIHDLMNSSPTCDAALLKEHPLFKNNKHALQIVTYYDEVETANCLGSHAGHNSKLGEFEINICNPICHRKHLSLYSGMFYYTLGNLRPELRSTHKVVQLIVCVSCPILGKYGFESILKPFIKDINILAKVITALILIYCIHSNLLYLGWLVEI